MGSSPFSLDERGAGGEGDAGPGFPFAPLALPLPTRAEGEKDGSTKKGGPTMTRSTPPPPGPPGGYTPPDGPQVVYVRGPSNNMGLAAFIVSLAGFVACQLACPVGLVLGIYGLRREPRGFAIAGIVLGALGSVVVLVWVLMVVLFGVIGGGAPLLAHFGTGSPSPAARVDTEGAFEEARVIIEMNLQADGAVPGDDDGQAHVDLVYDGWGRPIRYERTGPASYRLTSAGPDGRFGTHDDLDRATAHAEDEAFFGDD